MDVLCKGYCNTDHDLQTARFSSCITHGILAIFKLGWFRYDTHTHVFVILLCECQFTPSPQSSKYVMCPPDHDI